MKHMKGMRAVSFVLACIYNFFYLWALLEYLYSSFEVRNNEVYYNQMFSGFGVLIDMFFIYNLTFHYPIMFMNSIIIVRELRFEFFQHNRTLYYGGTRDELVLGVADMWKGLWTFLNLFNPFWWIGRVFRDRAREEELAAAYLDDLTDKQIEKYDLDF